MTQNEKDILFKDLCARLPYGVKCEVYNCIGVLDEVTTFYGVGITYSNGQDTTCRIDECKPYLFPISSMTEEQRRYINDRWGVNEKFDFEIDPDWGKYFVELYDVLGFINWCYENHFDINGLIPKDLAIDCTNLNIY